jgi:hypothetical protein
MGRGKGWGREHVERERKQWPGKWRWGLPQAREVEGTSGQFLVGDGGVDGAVGLLGLAELLVHTAGGLVGARMRLLGLIRGVKGAAAGVTPGGSVVIDDGIAAEGVS